MHARSYLRRGNQLHQKGDIPGATAAYGRYVGCHPGDKVGHYNLAVSLAEGQHIDAAILSYLRALDIDPWYPEALNNLGILLHTQGNLDSAIQCYARALTAQPDYEDAIYNLATAESTKGNYGQAAAHFFQVLKRNPQRADAWNNLGNVFMSIRQPAEALGAFQTALAIQPGLPDGAWNAGTAQLTLGNLLEGWSGFETRANQRHTALPRWDGSPEAGKSILVHAEQGLGDAIQFVRYCEWVQRAGLHVTFECHSALISLLRSVKGIDEFLSFNQTLPPIDFQIPLMSLPFVFRTSLDTIPAAVPYVAADPALVDEWHARLAAPPGHLSVGVVWAGNPKHRNDHNRSIPSRLLHILKGEERIAFYCLQQKPLSTEALESGMPLPFRGIFDDLTFPDTAAIMSNLDLVISVDTCVAHLAGALNRPVWTLLPYAPDWRWMLDRSDTPWYPSMRLFRQPRLYDWESVLEEVRVELMTFAAQAQSRPATANDTG